MPRAERAGAPRRAEPDFGADKCPECGAALARETKIAREDDGACPACGHRGHAEDRRESGGA